MKEQYDYRTRLEELQIGLDTTFSNILEPFVMKSIYEFSKVSTKRKNSILDVGCGCGYLTKEIAKRFSNFNVRGIDISKEAIKCARDNFGLNFMQIDILDIDSKEKFDILIYNMALHNIENLEETIKKSYQIVDENGIVIITIPHSAFWFEDKVKRGKFSEDIPFAYSEEKQYQISFKITRGKYHKTKLTYRHKSLSTYINIFVKYFDIVEFKEVDCKNNVPTMLNIVLRK